MVTDTYQLTSAVKQMYPVTQFFKDRYFPDGKNFYSEKILIDSKKQGRKIAPFVIPYINGIAVEAEAIRTDELTAPTIALKMAITPADLEKRAFGEDPNSGRAPEDREREVQADHLDEMRNSILRRHEKMCADILTTGKVDIEQYATMDDAVKGSNATKRQLKFYDSEFENRYKTTKKFLNMTAQEKIDTLYKMGTELHKKGHRGSDLVITSDVAASMFSDPEFLDYYDKLRVNIGEIAPEELPSGVVKNGTINVRGTAVTIYTYDEYYLNLKGEEQTFLPASTILMLQPNLGQTAYGQMTFVKDGSTQSFAEKMVARTVSSEYDNVIEAQLFSRPVPYPTFTDGWLYLDANKNN